MQSRPRSMTEQRTHAVGHGRVCFLCASTTLSHRCLTTTSTINYKEWCRARWHTRTRGGSHSCPDQQPPGEPASPCSWHSCCGDIPRSSIPEPRPSTPWLWKPPHWTVWGSALFPRSFIPDCKPRSGFNTGLTGSHRLELLRQGGWLHKVMTLLVFTTCWFCYVFQLCVHSTLCIPILYPTQITIQHCYIIYTVYISVLIFTFKKWIHLTRGEVSERETAYV